jgi:hypothetical protein
MSPSNQAKVFRRTVTVHFLYLDVFLSWSSCRGLYVLTTQIETRRIRQAIKLLPCIGYPLEIIIPWYRFFLKKGTFHETYYGE